ncbi:MAG: bifunctional adenosylcobinamide kinase/adenosylcobinamide-phosphate guanylyltransferase [Nitrospirota bacterium]
MNITFIIGGARSGKSAFALNEAMKVEGRKAYIATAEALDEEMRERIEKHKAERGSDWETCEAPLKISEVLLNMKNTNGVVLLDCLTIWLSNILLRAETPDPGIESPEETIRKFTDNLKKLNGMKLFIVSNEVGSGIVPENKLARRFRDLAGTLNQEVAGIANEVYMVTAGIPVKIK